MSTLITPDDLEPIGILGRYGFGVACFVTVCRSWGLDTPELRQLTADLWAFTYATDASAWVRATDAARAGGPELLKHTLGLPELDSPRAQALQHLISEVCDIASADLYTTVESWRSIRHTLNVVGVLSRLGVAPPSLGPFRKVRFSELGGWGQRIRAEELLAGEG